MPPPAAECLSRAHQCINAAARGGVAAGVAAGVTHGLPRMDTPPLLLGAISNAWSVQLEQHPDLSPLVAHATASGARHVELRMGSLGDAEASAVDRTRGTGYNSGDIGAPGDPNWLPVISKLQALADAYPQLTFNLAVSFKIYAGAGTAAPLVDPRGEQMTLAIEAAKLLGRPPSPLPKDWAAVRSYCGPHLRIVDPARFGSPGAWSSWESEDDIPDDTVTHIAAIASRVISENGVRLSIENAGQPFRSMGVLLARVRRCLPEQHAAELGLCFDPTNPVMSGLDGDGNDPLSELAALPPDMLMLAHFKQCVNRSMIPVVDDGDVNFSRYLAILAQASYRGPVVFEIPPHAEAAGNLRISFDYIVRLAANQTQRTETVRSTRHDPLTAPDGPAMSYDTYMALGLAKTAKKKASAVFANPNQEFDARVDEMMHLRTSLHEAHNVQSGGEEPYQLGADSLPKAGVPHGRIIKHLDWLGGPESVYPAVRRDWWVWIPDQYSADHPANLMVFTDGQTYLSPDGDVRAATVLANLISAGELKPTIGVFITPGLRDGHPDWPTKRTDDTDGTRSLGFSGLRDTPQRSFEYDSCTDLYVRFLLEDIVPQVEAEFAVSQDPADRAIVGISSGAVAAFVAAWHRPDAFSRVVSHCGSFTNIKGAHNLPWVVRNTAPRKDIVKVFLQTGRHDLDNVHGSWPLANREMAAALTFAGYHNKFVFGEGSHSWKHGGAIFPDTLRWLCLLHIIHIIIIYIIIISLFILPLI